MAKHKHAEIIKAWADGSAVEFYDAGTDEWRPCLSPSWYSDDKYRIKPAEPKRKYPETLLTNEQLKDECRGYESWYWPTATANAALRHAVDIGHVVTRGEFDRAVGDRKARDMAVAKEVAKSLGWSLSVPQECMLHIDEDRLLKVIARANPC